MFVLEKGCIGILYRNTNNDLNFVATNLRENTSSV